MLSGGTIFVRQYRIRHNKQKQVRLQECGPSFNLTPRRTAIASSELRKAALRQPREMASIPEKNTTHNKFGETLGRLHMEKQDLNKLQTRKMKGLKRGRGDWEQDDQQEQDDDAVE